MNYFVQDHLELVILVGAILNLIVMYLVINIATKADKRAKYEWAQMEFLAKIAKAQGVADSEIKTVLDSIK